MIKKIILFTIFIIFFSFLTPPALADHLTPAAFCDLTKPTTDHCVSGYSCQRSTTGVGRCQIDVIGKVAPPQAIKDLGVGSIGISKFLNNLITLLLMIGAVTFVFMVLWGALQWIFSGGSKEAIDSARRRIVHALIGFILLAVAFAVLNLIGVFTGFTFFWDKSTSRNCGPTKVETIYFDDRPGINECIHKVINDNCEEIYVKVENRFCGK